jgi:prophage antirepressor-like protein
MNELQVFTNKECGEIRALKRNGEAWFVAVDVCKALDINNARQAVTRLDDDEKCTVISNDGRQMNIVSESGLYSLVLSSRKKEAKTFKKFSYDDFRIISKYCHIGIDSLLLGRLTLKGE